MHILFISDNFPPEVNAPASRTFDHCSEWVKLGHKVSVITCFPNFPKGQVFDGYKQKPVHYEKINGINVIRVVTYITANEGFTRRILDYISFMISAILIHPKVVKPDIVIGTSPQFFTAIAAWVISRIKRIPFVFELRDIWPESIKAVGAMGHSKIIRLFERIELFLYDKADLIVSVTHAFKARLIERGVDGEKIIPILNGVNRNSFYPRSPHKSLDKTYRQNEEFIVGYIGTHGLAHSLETILYAAQKIEKEKKHNVLFLLIGGGARKKELKLIKEKRQIHNVQFIDMVSKKDIVDYWSIMDASIIHLKKTDLFQSVIPSKLFESFGMGIPILHGVKGESADIVMQTNTGLLFEPEDSDDMVEKLYQMVEHRDKYNQFKSNCPIAAEKFDRRILANEMIFHLKKLKAQSQACKDSNIQN